MASALTLREATAHLIPELPLPYSPSHAHKQLPPESLRSVRASTLLPPHPTPTLPF